MLKEIEIRFATKTYEFVNAKFDGIPTDEEYRKAKEFALKHKNGEVNPEWHKGGE